MSNTIVVTSVFIDHLIDWFKAQNPGEFHEDALNLYEGMVAAAVNDSIEKCKAGAAVAVADACAYVFTKGKKQGEVCGKAGCKLHANKVAAAPVVEENRCAHLFTKGKNAGETCGKRDCKTHAAKASPVIEVPVEIEVPVPSNKEDKCGYVFTKGKNKGNTCDTVGCKKHPADKSQAQKQIPKAADKAAEKPQKERKAAAKKDGFDFETEAPVLYAENQQWWKNWRKIEPETCNEMDCKWNRSTGLVVKPEEDNLLLIGAFTAGKFTPKNQLSKAAYEWAKNSGLVV